MKEFKGLWFIVLVFELKIVNSYFSLVLVFELKIVNILVSFESKIIILVLVY